MGKAYSADMLVDAKRDMLLDGICRIYMVVGEGLKRRYVSRYKKKDRLAEPQRGDMLVVVVEINN